MAVDHHKRGLEDATKELELLRSLAPLNVRSGEASQATEVNGMPGSSSEQQQTEFRSNKFHKPASKGGEQGAKGGGKGPRGHKSNQRGKPKGYGGSWQQQSQGRHQAWDQEWDSQGNSERETEENLNLRMIVKLLTTLVLRHESQHCINRLDTGYVVFLKTALPDNLATSTYTMAQKWHALKTKEPEKLEAPMRAVLLQHLFVTVKTKLMKMLETPSSRSTAVALGWLSTDEAEIMGLKWDWDQEQRRHVQDDQVKPLKVDEVKEALDTLILKVKEPLVVARYHATRPLSEQYQSPTLTMLLEVGLRTDAAHETWKLLRKLSQSAAWVAAGAFIRPEKIQRSPLAQKLATLLQSLN